MELTQKALTVEQQADLAAMKQLGRESHGKPACHNPKAMEFVKKYSGTGMVVWGLEAYTAGFHKANAEAKW